MTLRTRSANIAGMLITANGMTGSSGVDLTSQANAAYSQANSAYGQANAAYNAANNAQVTVYQNSSSSITTQKINFVNTSTITVSVSADASNANVAFTAVGGAAYDQANSAYAQANLAYAAANNSNLKSGGVINGTLNVTNDIIVGGNVYLQGNTTYINVATYQVNDPLMYIAANNTLTDSVDIGFVGAKNTSGTFSHTGLARDATDGKYKLFDNLPDSGHVGNVIDFANSTIATLVANVEANTLTLGGNTVATQANLTLAHNQANNARTQANNAYGQANLAYTAANNAVLKAGDTMTGQLNISSGGLLVTGNSNFDSGTLFVDSVNDRVGIGTTSPGTKLEVDGGIRIKPNAVTSAITADFVIVKSTSSTDATVYPYIAIANRNTSGNSLVGMAFNANDGNMSGGILADGLGTTGGLGSGNIGLSLQTTSNHPLIFRTNATERARISSTGDVGIGITSPAATLHVAGPIRVANTNARITFVPQGGGANNLFCIDNTSGALRIFREDYSAVGTGANGAVRMYLTDAGNLGIGTTSPSTKLDVSGTITCTALTETSSITFKENVDPIQNALNSITKLVGVTYDRKDGSAKQKAGLIAEEVNEVLPNLVQKDADGNAYGIHYTNLIAYLVESIKELNNKIERLESNR